MENKTRQQNEDIIRKACVQANPKLLELSFGCEVIAYGVGMWMHRASRFFYRVVEKQTLTEEDMDEKTKYCGFRPYSKIKLSCSGFQYNGVGFTETGKYPKVIELYKSLLDEEYKTVEITDVFKGEIEVLGHHPQWSDVMLAISNKEAFNSNLTAIAVNGCIYKNGKVIVEFNLTLPPLEQTDEVLEFIANLLK